MVSETNKTMAKKTIKIGLNPCSCGRWSQSPGSLIGNSRERKVVLILVLVEDGLRDGKTWLFRNILES